MKYTNEELELLDALEQKKPETVIFDNEALKVMAGDTLTYLNEKKSKRHRYYLSKYYPVFGV